MKEQQRDTTQDSNCVALANSGNESALRVLYGKYFQPIYRFCYWQTGNAVDAEDLTQEVFVAMVHSLKTFRGESSFKNWLYAIAKNIIAQWIRKKKQLPQVVLLENLADTAEWVSEDNEEHREKILSQLLSKLKDHEKKVIELRYLRNYSVAEVAQKLHISINNVKVITYRTLHKLQKIALTFRKV